jgi:CheY-like chemotaxis protein
MPEDGSPRSRPLRRLLLAIARAVALLILVAGFSGTVAIALPSLDPLVRYAAALVIGVALFETLRPREKRTIVAAVPAEAPVEPDTASEALAAAQHTIDELRADAQRSREETQNRTDSLTRDVKDLLEINAGLRQQIEKLESQAAEIRAKAAEESRLRTADAEEARAREHQLREQFEAESTHLQRAAAKALDEIQKTRATSDQLRAQIDREKQNGVALQKTAEALQAERDKLQAHLSDFDKRLATSQQELDGLRAERQRTRREIEETRQNFEVDKAALRATLEGEWKARLRDTEAEWNARMQQMSAVHSKQRDESQSGLRTLEARVAELQQQLEESRRNAQQLLSAGQELTRQLDEERQRFQIDLHDALDRERQSFREQLEPLTKQLEELRQSVEDEQKRSAALKSELDGRPVVDERALREGIEAEWSKKLQKVVNELTIDHENAIGEHIEAREAARAEMRSLNLKVKDLQNQLQSARDGRLGLLQRDDQLTQELERERGERQRLEGQITELRAAPALASPVDETTVREKVEAEWSEKLQTIVNHIASDHEADIGKAIEEREAARAEARNLAIKLSAMQQKLDGERQNREALAEKLRAANEEIVALRSAPAPLPPSVMPTEPLPVFNPEDEERGREQVLQFAEQAHEVLRRITSPGSVPVPAGRKAKVLFVHHDPALRTMWRDNLDKSGFEVHTAVDGLEGLRIAMAQKPDVVIADASMPKMDGRELCQLLKSNQETASVKVILMTGIYTTEAPADGAQREFEADETLRKPVKLEAMKTALTTVLRVPTPESRVPSQ